MALLSLPRDLWVEIGDSGRESRINRAFVVGGPAELIETIEGNFDIPIHHYVNVDFAGFQGLVSADGSATRELVASVPGPPRRCGSTSKRPPGASSRSQTVTR